MKAWLDIVWSSLQKMKGLLWLTLWTLIPDFPAQTKNGYNPECRDRSDWRLGHQGAEHENLNKVIFLLNYQLDCHHIFISSTGDWHNIYFTQVFDLTHSIIVIIVEANIMFWIYEHSNFPPKNFWTLAVSHMINLVTCSALFPICLQGTRRTFFVAQLIWSYHGNPWVYQYLWRQQGWCRSLRWTHSIVWDSGLTSRVKRV
jgi:hypothetical protein